MYLDGCDLSMYHCMWEETWNPFMWKSVYLVPLNFIAFDVSYLRNFVYFH